MPDDAQPYDLAATDGGSLAEDLAPDAPTASPLRAALAAPYSLAQWKQDLGHLAGGIPTHFEPLEDLHVRWVAGKLYAVIARPGGGKTAFLLEAVARALEAETDPSTVAVFCSWEEPLAELVVRLFLRADARVRDDGAFEGAPIPRADVRRWGRGDVIDTQTRGRLERARPAVEALLARLRLVDGDALGRHVHPVLAAVAAWMREANTRPLLVAVDYFQKLRAAGAYNGNRQRELQDVADALRRFAKGEAFTGSAEVSALDDRWAVPVLVGAQVNRQALTNGHPSGDEIREADDLLNDAAAVIALSYAVDAAGAAATPDDEPRTLRVSVPKHRDGRARKDEVASLPWRPARAWIGDQARRTHDRVTWCSVAPVDDDGPRGARGAGTSDLTADAVLPGARRRNGR